MLRALLFVALIAGLGTLGFAQEDEQPGYLGVVVQPRGLAGGALEIDEVTENGPAEKADVRVGDVIVTVNNQFVRRPDDLARILSILRPGDKIKLRFSRNGVQGEKEIVLAENPNRDDRPRQPNPPPQPLPDPAPRLEGDALLGVRSARPSTRDLLAIRAPAQYSRGALVTEVIHGTPADGARIPDGALIVALDGRRVDSPGELDERVQAAGAGKLVQLRYVFDGRTWSTNVRLASRRRGVERPPLPDDPDDKEELHSRIRSLERRMTTLEQRIVDLQRSLDRALRDNRQP